jgi:hypothetical protein
MDDRRVTFSNRQLTDMIVPLFFEQLLVMFVGIVRRVYIFIHKNVRRHHTGIMSEASEFQLRSALSLVGEGIL